MTRVLVCGGRDYTNCDRLFQVLDHYQIESGGFTGLVHGDARGADRLAGEWAAARGVPVESYPADWNAHGKAAGSIRNAQMLREGEPDVVVAFCGGVGTADMVRRARLANVPVLVVAD